ncbi:hypothetical protein [Pseudomonas moorei]|uniref:Phage protein n=1 Tax=Pseudomonas moorei TaxID=395599 RepID=A0A1H1FII0_9PSED|nr:hypothetical protein [Pseudomonas moorei]KAB0509677.1 hypothetical protein F7R06_01250 [Pseudomonas moorei]SDR00680.1 hypothetical protein SAMN04490195_2721 [Pseudomonas moorei]
MFIFGKWYPLMAEETGGDVNNNGGGNDTQDFDTKVAAAVEAAVAGLKTKNSELLGSLKAAKQDAARFEGIDPDAVRNILSKFASDEEAGLIAAGKIDEVLDKRTTRMKAGFEQETAKERTAREAAEARADKFSRRVLENGIRAEATAAGLHQYAIDDALLRASATFKLDDEGNPVAVEDAFGKDGKPLTLKEWFSDMKEKAPHWFPASANGGGAQPSNVNLGAKTMKRTQYEALSPLDQRAAIQAKIKIVD